MPGREVPAKCPWGIAEAEGRLWGKAAAMHSGRPGEEGQDRLLEGFV